MTVFDDARQAVIVATDAARDTIIGVIDGLEAACGEGEPPPPPDEDSPVKLGVNADLGGMLPLSASDPWNQNVSSLPFHPSFSAIKAALTAQNGGWQTLDIRPTFGAGTYNGAKIGISYVVVPASQPLVPITLSPGGYGGDPGPYPIPDNAPIENDGTAAEYSDGHVIVVQRDVTKPNHIGGFYELFRAEKTATGWQARSFAAFGGGDNTVTSRAVGQLSTDAAGLPILPGLIQYDAVMRAVAARGRDGDLGHAVRVAIGEYQSDWSYIRPATTVAGHNSGPVPFGSRWRLRSDWAPDPSWPDWLVVIINTLKRYGMIMADNSAFWEIGGVPDERWDNNWLSHIRYIKLGDLRMLNTGSIVTAQPS